MDSEATSQSSDSGLEGSGLSQVSTTLKKTKAKEKPVQGIDLLGEEGVTTHEKTILLTEHLQSRLGHGMPHSVHSVTVFCNFKSVLLPATDSSPLIPIPIIGYIQSKSSTAYAMTK